MEIDSIKSIEITVAIEKRFKISIRDEDVPHITTVKEALLIWSKQLLNQNTLNNMRNVANSYDAIIIGAGMRWPYVRSYLARAGMKVLVVEQHNKPGGYCSSFKRKGFKFDAAAHSLGGFTYGNLGNIFRDIGLLKKVKFNKFDPSNTIITPDHKISFWNSMDKTISDCQEAFPSEKKSIHNFFNSVVNQDSKALLGMKKASFKDLLESCFKDNKLISMLSFPLFGNSGLPPSRLSAFIRVKIC